jgi:molecular chaperone GrpE
MNTNPDSTTSENDAANEASGELESLKADLANQKDRIRQLAADFDNFRKLTAREADRRAAVQEEAFIRELLPVIDNLERALASDQSTSPQQLREGGQITLQQLNQLLRHHGIEPEDSLGQPFNSHRHEALRVGHDASKPDHTILEVFQRGYRRGNEVFRPAKVVVNDLSDAAPTG